jgi:drug/metabolite transporter (DMT)-like permease
MVEDKYFNASTLSFSAMGFVGFLTLIVFIFYSVLYGVNVRLLIIGLVGSIINCVGIVCLSNASSKGPAGPVQALTSIQTILFTIVMALFYMQIPKNIEIVALLIGIYGSLFLSIPDHL